MTASKKIVLIIAFEKFRDEEYAIPKDIFTKAGYQVVTASAQLGTATGKFGLQAKVDLTLDQLKVADLDAVLFIGGPGSFNYYDDPLAQHLTREAIKEGKLLGALCAAPGILAKAGVLKGKKATMDKDSGIIGQFGGTYTGSEVEVDGQIITATGPRTARAWAEKIIQHLHGK